ncbi:MAG: hypothetical protein RQ715_09360 [Methylococcales bacterium]|nr:hypothetical protein [Methylococcales bacterium]
MKLKRTLPLAMIMMVSGAAQATDACCGSLFGDDEHGFDRVESERNRSNQIVRQTNFQVSQHLASMIFQPLSTGTLANSGNKMAASSDGSSIIDSLWNSSTYTHLKDDDGSRTDYSTDLYQFVTGVDKQFGDFYVGSALTYVYGNTQQPLNDNNTNTVAITPYAAYKLTDWAFFSLLGSYNYTGSDNNDGPFDFDTHQFLTEVNLNGAYSVGAFTLKGRGGFRYNHTYISMLNSADSDYDELTWIGDVQMDFKVIDNLTVYTGALYEYKDQESFSLASTSLNGTEIHDGVVYIRGGVDYQVRPGLYLGVTGFTDVNDDDNNLYNVGMNVRLDL